MAVARKPVSMNLNMRRNELNENIRCPWNKILTMSAFFILIKIYLFLILLISIWIFRFFSPTYFSFWIILSSSTPKNILLFWYLLFSCIRCVNIEHAFYLERLNCTFFYFCVILPLILLLSLLLLSRKRLFNRSIWKTTKPLRKKVEISSTQHAHTHALTYSRAHTIRIKCASQSAKNSIAH